MSKLRKSQSTKKGPTGRRRKNTCASTLDGTFSVYRALRRRCHPSCLPGPWESLSAAERSCRRCPDDLQLTVSELAKEFPPKVLVQSGVAITSADGQLQPSPLLVPSAWLVFLQTRHGPTFDVLTPAGCLSGNLPLLSAWGDGWTQQARERWGGIILAADALDDVVVLRTLGFAAASVAGLADLRPDALAKLCVHFGWGLEEPREPPHDGGGEDADLPAAPSEASAGLILAAWSPARLQIEAPPSVQAVIGRFQPLHRRGLKRIDLGAWAPSKHYLDRLSLQLEMFPNQVSAQELFADLEENTTEPLATPDSSLAEPPSANLQEAWTALCRAERAAKADRGAKDQLARAQTAFDECLERELLRPLYQPGSDPLSANLRLVLQQLSRLFHRAARQADGTLQQMSPQALCTGELSKLVAPIMQVASRILTVTKEVRACDHAADHRPDRLRSVRWQTWN